MTPYSTGGAVRAGATSPGIAIHREGSTAMVRAGGRLDDEGRTMLAEALERLMQTGARYVTVRLVGSAADLALEEEPLRRLLRYAGQRLGELGGYLTAESVPRLDLDAARKTD